MDDENQAKQEEQEIPVAGSTETVDEAVTAPIDDRLEILIKQNRELAERLSRPQAESPIENVQLSEPTLEECGFDTTIYSKKMRTYVAEEIKRNSKEDEGREHVRRVSEKYQAKRKQINKNDYDVAETLVSSALSLAQQGVILEGCEDPAAFVYALGSKPDLIKQLSSIRNQTNFAFAVANIENGLKKEGKEGKPLLTPDTPNKGSAVGNSDSELERLRSIAAKTNDYTNVIAYKRSRRS